MASSVVAASYQLVDITMTWDGDEIPPSLNENFRSDAASIYSGSGGYLHKSYSNTSTGSHFDVGSTRKSGRNGRPGASTNISLMASGGHFELDAIDNAALPSKKSLHSYGNHRNGTHGIIDNPRSEESMNATRITEASFDIETRWQKLGPSGNRSSLDETSENNDTEEKSKGSYERHHKMWKQKWKQSNKHDFMFTDFGLPTMFSSKAEQGGTQEMNGDKVEEEGAVGLEGMGLGTWRRRSARWIEEARLASQKNLFGPDDGNGDAFNASSMNEVDEQGISLYESTVELGSLASSDSPNAHSDSLDNGKKVFQEYMTQRVMGDYPPKRPTEGIWTDPRSSKVATGNPKEEYLSSPAGYDIRIVAQDQMAGKKGEYGHFVSLQPTNKNDDEEETEPLIYVENEKEKNNSKTFQRISADNSEDGTDVLRKTEGEEKEDDFAASRLVAANGGGERPETPRKAEDEDEEGNSSSVQCAIANDNEKPDISKKVENEGDDGCSSFRCGNGRDESSRKVENEEEEDDFESFRRAAVLAKAARGDWGEGLDFDAALFNSQRERPNHLQKCGGRDYGGEDGPHWVNTSGFPIDEDINHGCERKNDVDHGARIPGGENGRDRDGVTFAFSRPVEKDKKQGLTNSKDQGNALGALLGQTATSNVHSPTSRDGESSSGSFQLSKPAVIKLTTKPSIYPKSDDSSSPKDDPNIDLKESKKIDKMPFNDTVVKGESQGVSVSATIPDVDITRFTPGPNDAVDDFLNTVGSLEHPNLTSLDLDPSASSSVEGSREDQRDSNPSLGETTDDKNEEHCDNNEGLKREKENLDREDRFPINERPEDCLLALEVNDCLPSTDHLERSEHTFNSLGREGRASESKRSGYTLSESDESDHHFASISSLTLAESQDQLRDMSNRRREEELHTNNQSAMMVSTQKVQDPKYNEHLPFGYSEWKAEQTELMEGDATLLSSKRLPFGCAQLHGDDLERGSDGSDWNKHSQPSPCNLANDVGQQRKQLNDSPEELSQAYANFKREVDRRTAYAALALGGSLDRSVVSIEIGGNMGSDKSDREDALTSSFQECTAFLNTNNNVLGGMTDKLKKSTFDGSQIEFSDESSLHNGKDRMEAGTVGNQLKPRSLEENETHYLARKTTILANSKNSDNKFGSIGDRIQGDAIDHFLNNVDSNLKPLLNIDFNTSDVDHCTDNGSDERKSKLGNHPGDPSLIACDVARKIQPDQSLYRLTSIMDKEGHEEKDKRLVSGYVSYTANDSKSGKSSSSKLSVEPSHVNDEVSSFDDPILESNKEYDVSIRRENSFSPTTVAKPALEYEFAVDKNSIFINKKHYVSASSDDIKTENINDMRQHDKTEKLPNGTTTGSGPNNRHESPELVFNSAPSASPELIGTSSNGFKEVDVVKFDEEGGHEEESLTAYWSRYWSHKGQVLNERTSYLPSVDGTKRAAQWANSATSMASLAKEKTEGGRRKGVSLRDYRARKNIEAKEKVTESKESENGTIPLPTKSRSSSPSGGVIDCWLNKEEMEPGVKDEVERATAVSYAEPTEFALELSNVASIMNSKTEVAGNTVISASTPPSGKYLNRKEHKTQKGKEQKEEMGKAANTAVATTQINSRTIVRTISRGLDSASPMATPVAEDKSVAHAEPKRHPPLNNAPDISHKPTAVRVGGPQADVLSASKSGEVESGEKAQYWSQNEIANRSQRNQITIAAMELEVNDDSSREKLNKLTISTAIRATDYLSDSNGSYTGEKQAAQEEGKTNTDNVRSASSLPERFKDQHDDISKKMCEEQVRQSSIYIHEDVVMDNVDNQYDCQYMWF